MNLVHPAHFGTFQQTELGLTLTHASPRKVRSCQLKSSKWYWLIYSLGWNETYVKKETGSLCILWRVISEDSAEYSMIREPYNIQTYKD